MHWTPSDRRCSNCGHPMRVLDLSGHYKRRVEIDTCNNCCLIWFDDTESVRLAGPGVADLVQQIHANMAPNAEHPHAVSLARVQNCPVCSSALKTVHNASRFGRTMHLECPQGHGYYQSFILYLAEKGFVRPLAWSDIGPHTGELFCANCGCLLPKRPHEKCPACQSAVGVIDPARLARAIDPNDVASLVGAETPAPQARVAQQACHACGGALDPSRDVRCPHCQAPVLHRSTEEAAAAAQAVQEAVRANYEHQHPDVSKARLEGLVQARQAWDEDAGDRKLRATSVKLAGGLLVGAVMLGTIYYLRQPSQQTTITPRSAPLMSFASQFKEPTLECAADAKGRNEVRVRQLLVVPGLPERTTPSATYGEMRAAYQRAIAARKGWEAGLDFEALAEQFVTPFASKASLPNDFIKRGQAVAQVERAAFCLAVGAIGPIMLAEDGFHIVQVLEAR